MPTGYDMYGKEYDMYYNGIKIVTVKPEKLPIEKYIINALVDNKMKFLSVEQMKEILKNGIDGLNKLKKEELYIRYAEIFGSQALVSLLKEYNC